MTTATASPAITAQMITPFIIAVREVFKKMVGVDITLGEPRLKTGTQATHDVCGIIGLSGMITGSVVLSFSLPAAEKLVEKFAGMRLEPSSPDFADAVGELANMVAGGAKQRLNLGGAVASISVPSVVIGKEHTISSVRSIPCIILDCTSPCGPFAVEICLKRNTEA